MSTRRNFLAMGATLIASARWARAQELCAVSTPASQAALSPEAALQRLKDGNARFLAGKSQHCDLLAQVKATAGGQAPFAAVLSCMDSRVAPELVFDQQIGDIFAVRIAGNFVDTDILGSLEYATEVAGAKLIVVLGHSDCGAIKGAIDDVKLGNLTALLKQIQPAIEQVGESGKTSKDKAYVQRVADQNAKDAPAALTRRSPILSARVKKGQLKLVAAMHDVSTGQVTFFS